MQLTDLPRGQPARIAAIEASDALSRKLLEMGLQEGTDIVVLHFGLFGRDPLAVSINDRLVALRRRDASHIRVEPIAS